MHSVLTVLLGIVMATAFAAIFVGTILWAARGEIRQLRLLHEQERARVRAFRFTHRALRRMLAARSSTLTRS